MSDESKLHTVPEEQNGNHPELQPLAAPMCPNCKADPVIVIGRTFNMGQFELLLVFCSACRHPIPSILLAIAQPQIAQPRRSPIIL